MLNSAEGRAWPRNLERDPRVTLTVQNMENPYEYVTIRGRVAERTHDGADEHIDCDGQEVHGPGQLPLPPARRTARHHPRAARARVRLRPVTSRYPLAPQKAAATATGGAAGRAASLRAAAARPAGARPQTHAVWAWRRRRVSPSGAISMCSLSAGR